MFFKALFRKFGFSQPDPAALSLYRTAVQAARQVEFFTDLGVPDTVDGRFDMISLSVSLVNRRIGLCDPKHAERIQELAQALFDVMFEDMDINLREFGVSDEGMKHKIKPMAKAHLGRLKAYTDALTHMDESERLDAMTEAVTRNIYRGEAPPKAAQSLAARATEMSVELDGATDTEVLSGRFVFAADTQAPADTDR